MAVTRTPDHNKEAIFLSSGLLVQDTTPLLMHLAGGRNILKWISFSPRNKVRSLFALLVWSLVYFVILPHSCSFVHMLEVVAPAQRQQSLRKNRNISSTAGRDLQYALREHFKLSTLAGLEKY